MATFTGHGPRATGHGAVPLPSIGASAPAGGQLKQERHRRGCWFSDIAGVCGQGGEVTPRRHPRDHRSVADHADVARFLQTAPCRCEHVSAEIISASSKAAGETTR